MILPKPIFLFISLFSLCTFTILHSCSQKDKKDHKGKAENNRGASKKEDQSRAGSKRHRRGRRSRRMLFGGAKHGNEDTIKEEVVVPVLVDPIKKGSITSYYSTYTTLEAIQKIEIHSRTGGIITKVLVKEGDLVKKDQLLATLDDQRVKAEVELKKNLFVQSQNDYQHQQDFFDKNLISQDELTKTKLKWEENRLKWLIAQQEFDKTQMKSPIKGIVAQINISDHNLMKQGQLAFTLVDVSKLIAYIYIPAQEGSAIKQGNTVKLTSDHYSPPLVTQAKITSISPVIDEKSGTIKISIELNNSNNTFKHGQFVKVSVVKGTKKDVIIVPRKAIAYIEGNQYLFLARQLNENEKQDMLNNNSNNKNINNVFKAERIPLKRGIESDNQVEVLSDVGVGDLLIVEGFEGLVNKSKIELINYTN